MPRGGMRIHLQAQKSTEDGLEVELDAQRGGRRGAVLRLSDLPLAWPLLKESAEVVRTDPRGFGEVLLTVFTNINGFNEIWSVEISG